LNRRLNLDFGLSHVTLAIIDIEIMSRARCKTQCIQVETSVLAVLSAIRYGHVPGQVEEIPIPTLAPSPCGVQTFGAESAESAPQGNGDAT